MNENNENLELERTLQRFEPAPPPDGLRERVLNCARAERRRIHRIRRIHRRRWMSAALATAAAALLFVGLTIEHREAVAGRELLTSAAPTRAQREVEEMTIALAGMLNGGPSAQNVRRGVRMRLSAELSTYNAPSGWRRLRQEPFASERAGTVPFTVPIHRDVE